MTTQERIVQELKYKLADAKAGKLEAFWSVDIQRNATGDPVATVTNIIDEPATDEQRATGQKCLWAVADLMREIYKP